jgi:hypothetical protein
MIRILVAILILLPLHGFSQGFINQSKKEVRKHLQEQMARQDTIEAVLNETDSSIHFQFRDSRLLHADFIYLFDEKGKCRTEISIASCDSCFKKYLNAAIDRKKYGWQKLNANTYISSFSKKMLLEIPSSINTPNSFIIRRMKWNRDAYQTLLRSK